MKIRRGFTRLQAVFRGLIARKKVRRWHNSATKIQQKYRGYKQTKKKREDFLNVQKATSVIQQEWRRWKFRNGIEALC